MTHLLLCAINALIIMGLMFQVAKTVQLTIYTTTHAQIAEANVSIAHKMAQTPCLHALNASTENILRKTVVLANHVRVPLTIVISATETSQMLS